MNKAIKLEVIILPIEQRIGGAKVEKVTFWELMYETNNVNNTNEYYINIIEDLLKLGYKDVGDFTIYIDLTNKKTIKLLNACLEEIIEEWEEYE